MKREKKFTLHRLLEKLAFLIRCIFLVDYRSVLAFRTLSDDYSHATGKIRLGLASLVPWYTYPFLEHLNKCDLSKLRVFEFGGGGSTAFWVDKAATVVTVERDHKWYFAIEEQNKNHLRHKLRLFHLESEAEYTSLIKKVEREFDVIIIDGDWRYQSAKRAVHCLSSMGVIIVDNSDWCPDTCAFLQSEGFSRLDFSGFGPSNQFTWSTSLFFRNTRNPLLNPVSPPSSAGYIAPENSQYMFRGECGPRIE